MKSLFWQIGDAARGVGSMALKGVDKAVSKTDIHLRDDSPLQHMAFSGHSGSMKSSCEKPPQY